MKSLLTEKNTILVIFAKTKPNIRLFKVFSRQAAPNDSIQEQDKAINKELKETL